ncbi:hypothetical protein ATT74_07685 [Salmonella enterica subsp. enterica serovar Panama]|uniref:Uncharacterized protein n=1 Tax=Salmonella enterica subsp. enterica serovar Panama TaxID=29472 RepID=A0A619AGX2_SALET|nr:hypothetical protein [Salmonella enterica subsp. enterica serovar Panama]ECX3494881.1 hypothetical protein [Salmonella enterica subsp. enterica serovar Panama]ECX6034256.1 hypothetical protein [Salmonella enterica subsp. enterica serovar Panama]EGU5381050.1 hypothetical protein [Salmonella enterica]EGX1719914.1 hypothetical protein [Salmonella enterica subsp. enterica serovar Panama]
MPLLAVALDFLFGLLVRLGAWAIRYLAPDMISMLLYRSTSSYAIMGLSVVFYISTFLAVMTFINDKATSLIAELALPNDYWITGLSMLPSNILSCLSAVFLAYTVYLTFRFKIFISRLITSQFTHSQLPPGQGRLPKP